MSETPLQLHLFEAGRYDHPSMVWERLPVEKQFACLDCGRNTIDEFYMVHNEVWRAANPSLRGLLFIGCLETRLGRRLSRVDFTACPLNSDNTVSRSARLRDRMAA